MGLVIADDGWRIPDRVWERMEPLLPAPPSHPLGCHRPRVPDRDAMNAILLVCAPACSGIARALDAETDDYNLMRALETAIAVCYARVFTTSSLLRLDLDEFEPAEPALAELHQWLYKLRAKVYAHTDKAGWKGC